MPIHHALNLRERDWSLSNGKRPGMGGSNDRSEEQYPDETEDQLISRFLKELEGDQALKRAVLRDVFNELLQELDEGKSPN